MKLFSRAIVLILIGSACALAAGSNERVVQSEKSSATSLDRIAQKTIDAIANRDVGFLASVVDDQGIVLGTDGENIPRQRFAAELETRRGSYCVLFKCPGGVDGLREVLSKTPHALKIMPSTGLLGQVEVIGYPKGRENPALFSPLFTLFFIQRNGEWKLQHIEYT